MNDSLNHSFNPGGLGSGGIRPTGGIGLAAQRMVSQKNGSGDSLPKTSFLRRSNLLGRSADFLRAKFNYERMMNLGSSAKDIQMTSFGRLKRIERIELNRKNKKNKKNDIH